MRRSAVLFVVVLLGSLTAGRYLTRDEWQRCFSEEEYHRTCL